MASYIVNGIQSAPWGILDPSQKYENGVSQKLHEVHLCAQEEGVDFYFYTQVKAVSAFALQLIELTTSLTFAPLYLTSLVLDENWGDLRRDLPEYCLEFLINLKTTFVLAALFIPGLVAPEWVYSKIDFGGDDLAPLTDLPTIDLDECKEACLGIFDPAVFPDNSLQERYQELKELSSRDGIDNKLFAQVKAVQLNVYSIFETLATASLILLNGAKLPFTWDIEEPGKHIGDCAKELYLTICTIVMFIPGIIAPETTYSHLDKLLLPPQPPPGSASSPACRSDHWEH
ncbi:MAG: hypothetical protein S4CHLAM102_16400 [Chlamydiia bacterium]|nr:hypothetical protein [Chlamydiia bacterium]